MRKVLIDTNVYSAFKRSRKDVIEAFRKFDLIGMDSTVLAELYSGFKLGTKSEENRQELHEFLNSKRVQILSHDQQTAEVYSHIFCSLKLKGTPIPTNDI